MHFFNVFGKKVCRCRDAAAMNFKKSTAAATHRDDFLKNLPLPRRHGHL
jgi:hypothetical protein